MNTIVLVLLAILSLFPPLSVGRRLEVPTARNPRAGPSGLLARLNDRVTKLLPERRSRVDKEHVATDIDLLAALLQSGVPLPTAVRALAQVACDSTAQAAWGHAAALLEIGVSATRAFEHCAQIPGLSEVARSARLSERSGAGMAQALARTSQSLRAVASQEVTTRAERAGVLIALPLTACFLPSFFILGLAPVIISLAANYLP